jgi:hypothetical protein
MVTNNSDNIPTAASGKYLQGAGVGTAPAFSTATLPSTATGTGTILRADGTNWSATTATYPNTAGTSGNILKSDGTNFVSSAPGTSGASLVLIQSQAASGASISFTTGLNSTYPVYMIVITAIQVSAGNPDLHMDFSTDGGSNYVNSGLTTGVNYNAYNTTITTNSNSTTTGIIGVSIASNATYNAIIYINNIGVGRSATYHGTHQWYNGTTWLFGTMGGSTGASTGVNALKFLPTSSTFATGTISIYGISTT